MSDFKIEPKILHGISIDVPNSIQFVSDNEVIYPSGGVLTIRNLSDDSQQFVHIKKDPNKIVNLIIMHPMKKFLAISSTTPKPQVEIYELAARKLVRTISVVAPVITMCYSWDGAHLIYVTSESDPIMYYYSFKQEKVENSTLATQPPAYMGPVTMISGNPTDSMIVVIVGTGLFRLLNLSDSIWRQYGFKKADQYNFLCVCWISAERLIAGTSDGRIILVDSGELKAIYRLCDTDVIKLASNKVELQTMMTTYNKDSTQKAVVSVIGFPDGFACVIAPNTIITFVKELNTKYVKKNEFYTSGDHIRNVSSDELNRIFSISVSPNHERIICCTCRAQMYFATLSGKENLDFRVKVPCVPLFENLHYGEVRTLATCPWKPLIVTSGLIDRRVCLYHYENNKLLFSQLFNNDIHSLAMHPTGLFCIIAFTDVCQIAYIMMNRFELGMKISSREESEEYSPLRSCKVMEFSAYGTLLAIADGVQIKMYDYIQYNLMFTLLGHRIEITSFKWMKDNVLLSCGLDGAVYVWDAKYGNRMADIVTRNCQYHDIEATSDGNIIYTVGEDGNLKEIKNEVVIQDLEVSSCSLTRIVMSKNDQIFVISNERGLVLVVNYPIVQKVDYKQYCVHTTAVTQMKITHENNSLITCDKYGMVCFWKILRGDGTEIPPPKNMYRCPDIFISEEEFTRKTNMITDLEARVNEIEFEHKFKLKELNKSLEDKMRKIKIEKDNTIHMLHEKISLIEKENEKQVSNLKLEKKSLRENFEKILDETEKHLKYNLYVRECEKNKELENEVKQTIKSHDEQFLVLESNYKKQLEVLKTNKEKEISVISEKYTFLKDKLQKELENQDRMKELVEEGADRTILEMQQLYKGLMEEETKKYTKLKHHVGVCREEIKIMEKELETAKVVKTKLEETIHLLENQNIISESRIEELLKEIVERDNILIPKEKRVHNMKLRAESLKQELRILHMRNFEIEKAMKPKDEIIEELDSKIQAFKQEVLNKEHEIKQLELKTRYLKEGVHAKEVEHEKIKLRESELKSLLYKMKNDIYEVYETMKDMNASQLKAATKKLFDKYVREKTVDILLKEMKNENYRHQEQMNNTIKALRRELAGKQAASAADRRVVKDPKQSYIINNILSKDFKADANKQWQKSDDTEEQTSICLHSDEGKAVDSESAAEEQDQQQTNRNALKVLQKSSSDKNEKSETSEKGRRVILLEEDQKTTERNKDVHEECQKTIKEMEERNRQLQRELFEIQKKVFHQSSQNLNAQVPSAKCLNPHRKISKVHKDDMKN